IDPGFRIADETEGLILRDEVLDELFEEEYGKENNESFFKLVDTFSGDRSDIDLQNVVRKLYDFSQAHPNPDQWLTELANMYDVNEEVNSVDELPFMQALRFDIQLQLEAAQAMLREAFELTKVPGGPAPYSDNLIVDLDTIERLLESASSWTSLHEEIQKPMFGRLNTCKGSEYEPSLVKKAKDLRDDVKKIVKKLQEDYFFRQPQSYLRDMREMQPTIASLAELVKKFGLRFRQEKREKGLVDFSDLEHYCLEILTEGGENEGTARTPSEAAMAYRRQFKEVLVDEYQDVNLVQEAILQLVTADGEKFGNLFMVGDVKQSIYRFRLAEPNLFLDKYRRFTPDGEEGGLRIDLSRNFRSRHEVLAGTNFIFKQIMGTTVGEIEYNREAELVKGAAYPEEKDVPVEVTIINQQVAKESFVKEEIEDEAEGFDEVDLEQSQLEARWMAKKIKQLVEERHPVYDPKTGTTRPVQYRDMVILLRSMPWAGEIMEEFKLAGVPIYANLTSGYFEATEVAIMISLLKVIDNPYQDIPLASVLRSPIVGCSENDLAEIRLASKKGTYFDAVKAFATGRPSESQEQLYEKVNKFLEKLAEWRDIGRQGALSDLIWQLYRDTFFYDFVGGMPGGKQRQANLRALYDRARQYEETSFRGLFRFLRFIERMKERGDDLGAARSLSEQEDVVRLMTIHSSKGLEFPVVFVAGLGRQFNLMDLRQPFLLDKEFGFASKYINIEKRISYPSLPLMAFKRKKRMEMIAEEMRVLYVALTRAKEKLFLLGTVKDSDKTMVKWERVLNHPDWLLPDAERAGAMSYLDWVGPALMRHRDFTIVDKQEILSDGEIVSHPARWEIRIVSPAEFLVEPITEETENGWEEKVRDGKPVEISSEHRAEMESRLSWIYPNKAATSLRSKQSVSDLKRTNDMFDEGASHELSRSFRKPIFERPKFMREKKISPAEIGTAMHTVMQHISLEEKPTTESVKQLLSNLLTREILKEEQAEAVDVEKVVAFFDTEAGQMLLRAQEVQREVPFNMSVPASEIIHDWQGGDESVLVQGIIDCLMEIEGELYLLDYKTDNIHERFRRGFEEAMPIMKDRYQLQINLYAKAVEQIWKRKVAGKYLFFFDGAHLLPMEKQS
ncbi:MAG TPA: helicase-exonuclease AddAB subunit AddA, partial [Chondromyces sp.]|nr:helicase-exonuclease AddAB subunit AddA [Chondromyces sp.]